MGERLKAVSLFAGVGGFDLALERSGVQVIASVEIDKNARKILEKQFPNSTILEDVCDVTGNKLRELGFDSDGIIVGGFPCQDLSVAGKRAGLAGDRSGLFFEITRILEETKAKYFILENVPGLLSSNKGRDMGTVIGTLDDLGYSVAWRVLDAQYFGVPQRRRRIFIVGCLGNDWRTPAKILAISEGRAGNNRQSDKERQDSSSTTDESLTPYIKVIRSGARANDGSLPAEVWAERNVSPTLNMMDNTGESRATVLVFASHMVDGARIQTGNTLNTMSAHMGTGGGNVPMLMNSQVVRRITPTECERLQGFPDGWTDGQTDGHRYKQMGNAVAVPVVSWLVKRLMEANK